MADSEGDLPELPALLRWIQLFRAGKEVTTLDDLCDGMVFARVFSEMHPALEISESSLHAKGNWVLTQKNISVVAEAVQALLEKSFENGEKVSLVSMLNPPAMAKGEDKDGVILLCKFILHTMFVSPISEKLGKEIVEMGGDVPQTLMEVMSGTTDAYHLIPIQESCADEEDEEDYYGKLDDVRPLKRYDPTELEQSAVHRALASKLGSAADYEDMIEKLKNELAEKNSELQQERATVSLLRENHSSLEQRYQQLLDKFAESGRNSPQPQDTSPKAKPRESFSKLQQELASKDNRIADLEKRIDELVEVEVQLQQMQDDMDLMRSRMAEVQREADKAEELRSQRDRAKNELEQGKAHIKNLQDRVSEEMERTAKLQSQLNRFKDTQERLEQLREEKAIVDAKLVQAERAAAEKSEQYEEARAELVTVRKRERELQIEKAELEQDLERERAKEEGGGLSLADELGMGGGANIELQNAKRQVAQLENDVADLTRELEAARKRGTDDDDLKKRVVELELLSQRQAQTETDLKAHITALEREQDNAAAKEAELTAANRVLQKSEQTLERELRALKDELEKKEARCQEEKSQVRELQGKLEEAKTLASQEKDLDKQVKQLKEENAKLRRQIEQLQNKEDSTPLHLDVAEYQRRCDEAEQGLKAEKQRNLQLEEQLKQAQQKRTAGEIAKKLAESESEKTHLMREKERLKEHFKEQMKLNNERFTNARLKTQREQQKIQAAFFNMGLASLNQQSKPPMTFGMTRAPFDGQRSGEPKAPKLVGTEKVRGT